MNNIDKGKFIMLFLIELAELLVLIFSICITCLVLTLEYDKEDKLLTAIIGVALLVVSLAISVGCILGWPDILFPASILLGVSGCFVFLGRAGHLKNKQHETL